MGGLRSGHRWATRGAEAEAHARNGRGEIGLDDVDKASGFFTTRPNHEPAWNSRRAVIYTRMQARGAAILDGGDAILPKSFRPSI